MNSVFHSATASLNPSLFQNHAAITVLIFILTSFVLLKKPFNIHEAWATTAGAALMLLFGSLSLAQAYKTVSDGSDVLIFLFALMLFSALLDRAGFFEYCALSAANAARGNVKILYRNIFLVGAAVTALLSLDTTAIILTPIVVSLVQKLKLKAHPFLIACAFVANTGSLLLPVSNLTNLLFQHTFNIPFFTFAAHMFLAQIVAIACNYFLFVRLFSASMPTNYKQDLPEATSAIGDQTFFKISLAVLLLVLIGYFIGALYNIQPYIIALIGCVTLLIAGFKRKQLQIRQLAKQISWELFPFVIGLFIVIKGIENLGLVQTVSGWLATVGDSVLLQILAMASITAIGSNIVNNVPMALLSIAVLEKSHTHGYTGQFAALLGCNLGPNLTIAGSLATMLVITTARKRGEQIGAWEFFKTGVIVTPITLLAASLALWLSLAILDVGVWGGAK